MTDSIWNTLGIGKTSDVNAIKRAYAAKLKSVRPDENPVAFQLLREAREKAERLATSGSKRRTTNPDVTPGPNEPDDNKQQSSKTARQELKSGLLKTTTEKSQNSTDQRARHKAKIHHSPTTIHEFSPSVACVELFDWLSGKRPDISEERISTALSSFDTLTIEQRQIVDHLAVTSIQANFKNRPEDEYSSELGIDFGEHEEENSIIVRIAEGFGWYDDERRIALILGTGQNEFVDRIRSLKEMRDTDPATKLLATFDNMIKQDPSRYVRFASWVLVYVALLIMTTCGLAIWLFYEIPARVRVTTGVLLASFVLLYALS